MPNSWALEITKMYFGTQSFPTIKLSKTLVKTYLIPDSGTSLASVPSNDVLAIVSQLQ